MDLTRFPGLHRQLRALPGGRRDLLRGLAVLPLLGALPGHVDAAPGKDHHSVAAEKKGKTKKQRFCLNGKNIRTDNRKRKRRLRRQGATRGRCKNSNCTPDSFAVTCANTCKTSVTNNCGTQVNCGYVMVPPLITPLTTFGSSGSGASEFSLPVSVTASANGLVAYIPDYGNSRISIWSRPDASSQTWSNVGTFGTPSPGLGTFSSPAALTFSNDETIMYITDYSVNEGAGLANGRVTLWTRPDTSSQTWTNPVAFGQYTVDGPLGIALSADTKTMFVAEYDGARVSVWTRPNRRSTSWRLQTAFGTPGSGASELQLPTDVTVSADGLTVWVADSGNSRISVWSRSSAKSADWANVTTFGSAGSAANQLAGATGVTLSANQQTLWIGDSGNNRISVWSRVDPGNQVWTPLTTYGTMGTGPAQFDNPGKVSLAADEATIWVADTANSRISVLAVSCSA